MKTIVTINYPMVIFDDGSDCQVDEIKGGTPRIGFQVNDILELKGSGSVDVDCVGGACPIR